MESSYIHLEDRGRRIFRVIYDQMSMEAALERDELSQELLQIFHTRIVSIIQDSGEIPSMEAFFSEPRTALIQGIISEAKRTNKGETRVPKNSPIHIAVITSQEKIDSLLQFFIVKGSGAAIGYANRLLKKSSSETDIFKKQAEEALKKHHESEEVRRKSNLRLSEAIGKFQANRHMLLGEQEALEKEKYWLISERDFLNQEVQRMMEETAITKQRNEELEIAIENNRIALRSAEGRIQNIEMDLERGGKARKMLVKVGEKLQSVAKNGNTGPERFDSVLNELEGLRKQEEKFVTQNISYWRLMEKSLRLESLNEVLIKDLEAQKRLTKQAGFASILEGNFHTDGHMIEGYYYALEEYFALSLREYGKDFKDHNALEESVTKVREFFFLLRSRWIDPLELGEERLGEVKRSWKNRNDLQKYNLSRTVIEWIYREMIWFLESFIQNRRAIHAYNSAANARM